MIIQVPSQRKNIPFVRNDVLTVPPPAGDAISDFEIIRKFFAAAPNNAVIQFPSAAEYTVWAGAYRVKPGQTILQNNALLTQANEIVTTTTAALGDGTITIGVSSTSGLRPGQYIAIYGTKVGGNTLIVWNVPRIASVNTGANTITLESAITLTLNVTAGAYDPAANAIQTGASLMTRGPLIDAATLVNGQRCYIEKVRIDGNMANNDTNNRWEYDAAIKMNSSGILAGVYGENLCGEGIVVWGQNPAMDDISFKTLNGNGIHLNEQCYDAFLNNIKIDTCNQNTNIGHADGGIIASNNTYRTQVQQWRVVNSKRAAIGAWDSADNAFAKISKGYAEACWRGIFCISSSFDIEGIEITDFELYNCGPSFFGTLRSSVQTYQAKRWKIQGVMRDSMAYLSGFLDSEIALQVEYGNSGVATSTTIAAGYANNYTGAILSELSGVVNIVASTNTQFTIQVRDGGAPSNKSAIFCSSAIGGYCMDNLYNFSSIGNTTGILINANHINCRGTLKARAWASGHTGVNINLASQTVNAAVPAGWDKPRNNAFVVDTYLDTSTVNSTFHVKANNASNADGWLAVSGRVYSKATATATCYGIACQNTPKKTRLDDIEIIGPASNFVPLFTAAAVGAGEGRARNIRSYPAPAALAANWVSEDSGPQTLPV